MNRRAFMWMMGLLTLAVFPAGAIGQVDDPPAKTVKLVINYNDGVEKHFTRITWERNMTVLDALRAAARHPRGIQFEFRGSGETAFLTQIDGTKNEGRGLNWLFRVNGELAERSFAVYRLEAGDTVLWKFDKYR